jgi:hypothetical protein
VKARRGGVALVVAFCLVGCSGAGSGAGSGPSWLKYRDADGLFHTELPPEWQFQTFTQSADPSYPIERGVVFAAADSPVLAAAASADPNALGNAALASNDLSILVFIARSDLGATPKEVAVRARRDAEGQSGYRLITFKPMAGMDGYELVYTWDGVTGIPSTAIQAFAVSGGHMMFIAAAVTTADYARQAEVMDHFLATLQPG